MKRLAQFFSGDVDLRLSLEIDSKVFDVWIIRLTPGFVQVVLHIVVYDRDIRSKELSRLHVLSEMYPDLYEILSERAGRVIELRCFLAENKCRFYVWVRDESWTRLLLPVVKKLYQHFRQKPSST